VGGASAIADVDGAYRDWFTARDAKVAVFRPDFYVFGTGASVTDSEALAAGVLGQINTGTSWEPRVTVLMEPCLPVSGSCG
jgi:hypothetical protein